jgi:hypothetical protein
MTEIIDTLTELRRMYQLNMELLEQLGVACGWLLEHNVPIPNASTFTSLVTKSLALLREIQVEEPRMLQYQKLTDEKKQHFRTDEEEPVPQKPFSKKLLKY